MVAKEFHGGGGRRTPQWHPDQLRDLFSVSDTEPRKQNVPISSSANTAAPPGCKSLKRVMLYTLLSTIIHLTCIRHSQKDWAEWNSYQVIRLIVLYSSSIYVRWGSMHIACSITHLCHLFTSEQLQILWCHVMLWASRSRSRSYGRLGAGACTVRERNHMIVASESKLRIYL